MSTMPEENPRLLMPRQGYDDAPTIKFLDGQFLFSMTSLQGTRIEAFRSEAAVREAFTGIPVDSGWLAPSVQRWGDGRNGEWAVLYVPPGLHKLELTTDDAQTAAGIERITAPLPGMVFFGCCVKYWLWALRSDKFEAHHELMRAPLPNVMLDAEVCWGPHKPPSCSGSTIARAWELFVSTTFSNHVAAGKSKQNREDVREVLKRLASSGSEKYPAEDLVRYVDAGGLTIDTVIRHFIEAGALPAQED
jgi:Prokaryotic E2 family D